MRSVWVPVPLWDGGYPLVFLARNTSGIWKSPKMLSRVLHIDWVSPRKLPVHRFTIRLRPIWCNYLQTRQCETCSIQFNLSKIRQIASPRHFSKILRCSSFASLLRELHRVGQTFGPWSGVDEPGKQNKKPAIRTHIGATFGHLSTQTSTPAAVKTMDIKMSVTRGICYDRLQQRPL